MYNYKTTTSFRDEEELFKILFALLILFLVSFQSCVGNLAVNFLKSRQSVQSEVAGGGGTWDGKPDNGYYCRIFDNLSCQSQVANLQSLVKVDDSGIHLIQDNCSSASVNFLNRDPAVEFTSLAPNFLGVTRGIFKKCEVGSDNFPLPPTEMSDAYCVSHQENIAVVINKDLANGNFNFDVYFRDNTTLRTARGDSVLKSSNALGNSYSSTSQEFELRVDAGSSQTSVGYLNVVLDEKPLSINLSCRSANPEPTVIIERDFEISPTWINIAGLAGYWKLNEPGVANGSVVVDSSPYSTNGVLITDNSGAVKSDSSVLGGAISFDGANDAVNIPNPGDGHLSFGVNSFSYMVWIKKTGNVGSFDMPIAHGGASRLTAGYDIECGQGCLAYISDGQGLSTSHQSARFTSNGSALVGRWAFLVAVVDRSQNQLRTYLDGLLVSTTDISNVGSVTGNTYDIGIGNSEGDIDYFFMGSIDDVAIWSRALSSTEITEIFQRLRPKFY